MLEIIQIPVLNDNYIIYEPTNSKTAVVDPAVASPVLDILKQKWSLDYILNTHHGHIDANLELKTATHCQIIATDADQHRIPGIDKTVKQDDEFMLGAIA